MSQFVDECQLHVKGGMAALAACRSAARRTRRCAGPTGAPAATCGSSTTTTSSLIAFKDHPHRAAKSGTHGKGKAKHGHGGDVMIVAVPEGTVLKDQEGIVLADLVSQGDRFLAAEGGRGGRGNARFLSNRRRAPAFAGRRLYVAALACRCRWRSSARRSAMTVWVKGSEVLPS